jgi:activator of the mannose operon, transcriptional antiterminator
MMLLDKTEQYFPVDSLAESLGVSEKTIRNDLKALDKWLREKYPDIFVIRKPSLGVILQAGIEARKTLRSQLTQAKAANKQPWHDHDSRKIQLILLLLENDKIFTMQQLADQFYVSKSTISTDLADVEVWLKQFDLRLVRKTNFGLKLEGEERAWRKALVSATELLAKLGGEQQPSFWADQLFYGQQGMEKYDWALIENRIRSLEPFMNFRFTDQAIMSLIVHISIAIKRMKQKKRIKMDEGELAKLQGKEEYDLALKLARALEKDFALSFPGDEVGYLTLHLLGAKIRYDEETSGDELEQTLAKIDAEAVDVARRIIDLVSEVLHVELAADQELLIGLAIHLHAALNRLRHGLSLSNPMIREIKQMYRYTFDAILAVIPAVEKQIASKVSEDEAGYLTLHIQAALVRREQQSDRLSALVVCSTGTGTSHLLASKLKRSFSSLKVLKAVSVFELRQALAKYNPDVLISTVPLPEGKVPSITVSPLLTEREKSQIEVFLKQKQQLTSRKDVAAFPTMKRFLSSDLIWLDVEETERFGVIDLLANQLQAKGFVSPEYKESAMRREWLSSTAIGGGIAIPHGSTEYIQRSGIAVARLKEPIEWGGEPVWLIFLFAMALTDRKLTQQLFEEMAALVEDVPRRKQLEEQKTIEAFLQHL